MRLTIFLSIISISTAAFAQTAVTDTIATQQLNEVVVNGEKPQVRGEDGILIVDLPAIVRDKPVNNILEALGYTPGVINNNGMIGLAGASNVTIILNGELINMPIQNLYELLYTTPIDRLKNVEIMYSAPAKYHVNGAIINVVLKTPRPLDGLQGQIRTGYNQGHYGSYGGGLSAIYATKDWTFDLNYGLSRTRLFSGEDAYSNHLFNGTRTMIVESSRSKTQNWSNTIYASAGWKTLKITYNGLIVTNQKRSTASTGTLGDYSYKSQYEPINFHNIALRYSAPFGLTVGGDYTYYSEKRSQSIFKGMDYTSGVVNNQDINKYHLYLDQTHQFGKWQLNYGGEYQHSADHSSQQFNADEAADFDNTLKEDVAGGYIGTQASFEWGLSFNASAKAEYFHNNYRHNWNFIPRLGATYYRTPKSIFQLNLSSNRVYPSYWEQHGGTNYMNDYSMVIGNPDLQPYINYDVQLNYIFKQKYAATLYLKYGDKAFEQMPYQSPDDLKLIYQTINLNFNRIVGLNLYAPFNVSYIWNVTASANIFNQREKADHFHDISFDNRKWIFYGSLNNTFKFAQSSPISLSVDFSYISPSMQGISNLSALWRMDAGIKWQFGKKRCCELDLKANDIFNTWSPTLKISTCGQDYRMKVREMTRNLKLTFIWRFNGFKPKDNNIDISRFGTGK